MDMELMRHLAELSGLGCPEEELAALAGEMEEIIRLMDKVKAAGGAAGAYRQTPVAYGSLRQDEPGRSPETDQTFRIPKMLG